MSDRRVARRAADLPGTSVPSADGCCAVGLVGHMRLKHPARNELQHHLPSASACAHQHELVCQRGQAGYSVNGPPRQCVASVLEGSVQTCAGNPCTALTDTIANGQLGTCGATISHSSSCSIVCNVSVATVITLDISTNPARCSLVTRCLARRVSAMLARFKASTKPALAIRALRLPRRRRTVSQPCW